MISWIYILLFLPKVNVTNQYKASYLWWMHIQTDTCNQSHCIQVLWWVISILQCTKYTLLLKMVMKNIHELSIVKPAKTSSQILNVLITCFHKSCVQIFFLIFFLLSNQVEFYDRDENRKKCHYFVKLIIFLFLQIPIIFSSLNYNCSNL